MRSTVVPILTSIIKSVYKELSTLGKTTQQTESSSAIFQNNSFLFRLIYLF